MRFTFSIFFILLGLTVVAQEPFNKRYALGYNNLIFRSIEIIDDKYFISGIGSDSLLGSVFLQLDQFGEVEFHNIWNSLDQGIYAWGKDLVQAQDSVWFVSAEGADTTGGYAVFAHFTSSGDTLRTRRIYHPYHPDDEFIVAYAGGVKLGSKYYSVLNVGNSISNPKSGDLLFVGLDSNLKLKNYEFIVMPQRTEGGFSITGKGEKIYLGCWRSNQNLTTQNYTSQLYIQVRDTAGQLLDWRLYPSNENDFLMGPADALYVEEDGSVIVGSRKGIEVGGAGSHLILWLTRIIKFNSSLDEVIWETSMSTFHWSTENYISKIVRVYDDSGYVFAGTEDIAEDGIFGMLGKVGLNGDSLWLRHYQFVTTDGHYHYIYDMEQTPDGGFVMVGEARPFNAVDPDFPPPIQQGWILKVDEFGCLVPGCQTVSTAEAASPAARLEVWPNPASDYLNVFFHRSDSGRELWQFRLVDVLGRVHSTFQTETEEMTFIVDVQGLAAGLYFLEAIGPQGQRRDVAGGGGVMGSV
jgi:hypothetical protein